MGLDVHRLAMKILTLIISDVFTGITFPSQDDVTVFMEGGENPVQVCATLSPPRNISVPVLFTSTSEIGGT